MKLTIFESFNLARQCRRYNLPIWQCPQFLFLVLGLIVISSSLAIYFIGVNHGQDPELAALIVLAVSTFLLIISFSIIRGFEKLAEVARLKAEFVSVASHQLRAPLSNLKWVVDLLASGKIDRVTDKQAAYPQILKENSYRMEGLVSDLIVVSRLETNNLPFKAEKVFLGDLLKSLVFRFQAYAKASNVEIELKIQDRLPDILLDSQKIEQAISNLLDNAIRYSLGKGKVTISVAERAKCLLIKIQDNGAGIPAEDQKYIFQKFFRASNAAKVQAQGSGLGLYIAKCIVEKSGGKINFVSEKEKGTTFWFTLPIKK